MGCFWGIERFFWRLEGVISTSVGYTGGNTPSPNYQEVCTGTTGHVETVQIIFQPEIITYEQLLKHFWEEHDPTQGMRQGNDIGSQYRSAIFYFEEKHSEIANHSLLHYQKSVNEKFNDKPITTTIEPLDKYYFAEEYHQQYLAKNPNGYCAMKGLGVACKI